jgi:hypothetical protein
MSFLWRSTDSSANLCKLCVDKDKRINDYEIFFNETKEVLKSKEENLLDHQIKITDKISEVELLKKSHENEKRQWLDEKRQLNEQRKKHQQEAMEWEFEKSKYDEKLEDMNSEKMVWMRYQKTLEEKVKNLVHSLKQSDGRYQELLQRVTEQNVLQSDEIREREEDIISIYDKRIEELIEEFDDKEQEWQVQKQELQCEIKMLEESALELQMQIQDGKYEKQCLIEKHEEEMNQQQEKWEQRITDLNETYDTDFLQYKEHFNQKEEKLEQEKNQLVETLQTEIETLKKENEVLEDTKKQVEKKIAEIDKKQQEINTLENKFNEEQKKAEQLKSEKNHLERQLEINKKTQDLKTTTSQTIQTTAGTVVQTIPSTVKLDPEFCDSEWSEERLQTKKKRPNKKKAPAPVPLPVQGGYTSFYPPYVDPMEKNYEKKTDFEKSGHPMNHQHHVIDVNDFSENTNFFLPNSTTPSPKRLDVLGSKIKMYEDEIEKLKQQNNEYMNKLKSYECNSILQFNRNLRSGIPVRFFPYHTNMSIQSSLPSSMSSSCQSID